MLLALLLILSSCRQYGNKPDIPMKEEDYEEERSEEPSIWIHGAENLPEPTYEIGSEVWKAKANQFLNTKKGEIVNIIDTKNLNPKNPNKIVYSTRDIEYSEEWRIRVFKATKKHLINVIPNSLPNCNVNSFGFYNPNNVRYIGNNTFRLKIYLTIKCKNNSYINEKYFWYETGYSEYTNQFEFYFIKERFAN
jgi:hypothetical protein